MATCKTCGKEFHWCSNCQQDYIWESRYCSEACFAKSNDYIINMAKMIAFLQTLDDFGKGFIGELIKEWDWQEQWYYYTKATEVDRPTETPEQVQRKRIRATIRKGAE